MLSEPHKIIMVHSIRVETSFGQVFDLLLVTTLLDSPTLLATAVLTIMGLTVLVLH